MKTLLYIPILFLIVGCATTQRNIKNKYPLKQLKHQLIQAHYFIAHDRCFIDYNKCKLDALDRMKTSGQLIKRKSLASCWQRHEKCVITVDRMYKKLLQRHAK